MYLIWENVVDGIVWRDTVQRSLWWCPLLLLLFVYRINSAPIHIVYILHNIFSVCCFCFLFAFFFLPFSLKTWSGPTVKWLTPVLRSHPPTVCVCSPRVMLFEFSGHFLSYIISIAVQLKIRGARVNVFRRLGCERVQCWPKRWSVGINIGSSHTAIS